MERDSTRIPGEQLSEHERALLEILCTGQWPGAQQAQAQLVHARWGGWGYEECECFLIEVPKNLGLEPIPQHPGGPFSSIGVFDGENLLGHLDLWVVEGRLHSVDYMTFEAPANKMPSLDQLGDEAFAYWVDEEPTTQ